MHFITFKSYFVRAVPGFIAVAMLFLFTGLVVEYASLSPQGSGFTGFVIGAYLVLLALLVGFSFVLLLEYDRRNSVIHELHNQLEWIFNLPLIRDHAGATLTLNKLGFCGFMEINRSGKDAFHIDRIALDNPSLNLRCAVHPGAVVDVTKNPRFIANSEIRALTAQLRALPVEELTKAVKVAVV